MIPSGTHSAELPWDASKGWQAQDLQRLAALRRRSWKAEGALPVCLWAMNPAFDVWSRLKPLGTAAQTECRDPSQATLH